MSPIEACHSLLALPVEGIVHVGANRAKEYEEYKKATTGPILYLEAIPSMAEEVRAKLDGSRHHTIRQAVVSERGGERVRFNVASNDGRSSSMLEFGHHAELYPDIVAASVLELQTETLDDILESEHRGQRFNLLVIDVQGAELKVLRGAVKLLCAVDAVFAEVSSSPLYDGGCTFLEVANFLAAFGLHFRGAKMHPEGWGDAIFARRDGGLQRLCQESVAKGKPATQSSLYKPQLTADGAVSGVLGAEFSVHTAVGDPAPWWQVDLQSIERISRLIFVDRPKYEARARSLLVEISSDGTGYQPIYDRSKDPLSLIIDLDTKFSARFVRVRLTEPGPLHFRQLILIKDESR